MFSFPAFLIQSLWLLLPNPCNLRNLWITSAAAPRLPNLWSGMRGRGGLGHALRMAVPAVYGVDVVPAAFGAGRGVHAGDIQATARDRRMTFRTGWPCVERVRRVTIQTAHAFMHAPQRPVIACAGAMQRAWRVTLVADALPHIAGNLHLLIGVRSALSYI